MSEIDFNMNARSQNLELPIVLIRGKHCLLKRDIPMLLLDPLKDYLPLHTDNTAQHYVEAFGTHDKIQLRTSRNPLCIFNINTFHENNKTKFLSV